MYFDSLKKTTYFVAKYYRKLKQHWMIDDSQHVRPADTTNGQSVSYVDIMKLLASPVRPNAFELDDETKVRLIEGHFAAIMDILGLDRNNHSLRDTPKRVAKMYVHEIFSGLNPANKPDITLFDNAYRYGNMIVEKDITVFSNCEHHFVPIVGKAHVAYISKGQVIGLPS